MIEYDKTLVTRAAERQDILDVCIKVKWVEITVS